ncbi:hypothetical protein SteCoe_24185 [Stentor coeruleus]|uniref:Lebercilin domain-containing protein n=1 Tax=Stentor coeruleus TaxID=5963 RepID=A0A1R2BI33_9CILI|nr:hypothetical protein SteCoe_24185 [Stentor coeruleus]
MNGHDESKEENNMLDSGVAIEKLKAQNEKLRNELKVLSKALDETLEKQKKQDRKKGRVPVREEPSNETEKEIQVAFAKINKYKKDIASMKKQLDGNLNEARITDLENQSRFLSKRIQELENENSALQKIEREQKKALDVASNAQGYPEKLDSLRQEIKTLKEKYRELQTKQKQDEKVLKEQHEKCVDLEEKCRKLKGIIRQKKNEEDEPKVVEVTEKDIVELEDKIKETEQKKKEEERKLKKRIKDLENQINESKHNINMLNVKLKEKDQECRLSVLKIKELKRAVRHNQLKPLPKAPPKLESRSNEHNEEDKRMHDTDQYRRDSSESKNKAIKDRSRSSSSKSSKKYSDDDRY